MYYIALLSYSLQIKNDLKTISLSTSTYSMLDAKEKDMQI